MIAELLSKRKIIAIGLGAYAAGLIITTFFLDPVVPLDVHLTGLFQAIPAALAAASLVLIYRSVRIINWAQFALGAVAAQLFYELYAGQEVLPYGVSLVVGLLAGPLVGILVGIIFATLFFKHPRLVLTVGTILMTGLIQFITQQVDGVFNKPGEIRPIAPVLGPWPDKTVTIGQTPFRVAHLVAMITLIGLCVGLVVFFRRTRVGTAVRAAAENSERASLLGINVKLLQVGVWGVVGLIASVGATAALPVTQYNPASPFDFIVLLLPLSAAVVGRMASMPVAFFTALGLSMMKNSLQFSAASVVIFADIGLFAVIMVGLLIQKKRIQTRADEGTSWKAVKEVRPTPHELLALPVVARTRRAIMLVVAVVVLALPWITSIRTTNSLTDVWIFAIIAVSLTILTGWSGQISLGQFALVAIGAFVGGIMTTSWGIPFWFAGPLAGLVGAAFAILIGIPALRIRGLFLAVTTFAIAAVLPVILFDAAFLRKFVPAQTFRPKLFFIDFENERWMYYLMIVYFVAVVLGVRSLRRSRAGRVLIALRDNEAGAQSFGVDVVRTRLAAFGISGFIAALAGVLLVHKQLGMEQGQYAAQQSIGIFILVVIGGVSSVMGAVLGAFTFTALALFAGNLAQLLQGILGVVVLMAIPGGLTQIVFGVRDAVLRVIAMRQHIIVPSLFADYSPEAWEKRLVPLAPALQTQGLAALKPEQRYRLPSKIFGRATT